MKRVALVFWCVSILTLQSFAQGYRGIEQHDIQPISDRLDELERDYRYEKTQTHTYDTLLMNVYNFRSDEVPVYADEVVQRRLMEIPAIIPMDYNRYVKNFIQLYTQNRRNQVSRMLGLTKVYFPLFERELDRAGLPLELKYLSVVESALNPHARSRVGATGLWQFMLRTAKEYGLTINSFVDERKDPYKSTIAAIQYLKDAYEEYDDWLLAIASYNCGMGNVRKAILRSGGKYNFWEIMPYLPRETRGYVPAFIAAAYTFSYAPEHNLYPIYVDFSYEQDTIQISRMDITLDEIAKFSNTGVQTLKNLNPELKIGRIPYSNKPYVLRVPRKVSDYFATYEADIRKKFGEKRQNTYLAAQKSSTSRPSSPPKGKLVYHTVREGEVVGTIAERYHVSSRAVANWNNLYRYRIRVGQRLRIYTPPSYKASSNSVARKSNNSSSKKQVVANNGNAQYYTVKRGDTLWEIARKHQGLRVSDILNMNPGLSPSRINVGQKIRVR